MSHGFVHGILLNHMSIRVVSRPDKKKQKENEGRRGPERTSRSLTRSLLLVFTSMKEIHDFPFLFFLLHSPFFIHSHKFANSSIFDTFLIFSPLEVSCDSFHSISEKEILT